MTIGVITLSKLGLDQFDADDLRLLTILADQAATAVESARLLTRTQDLAGELRRLLDMSAELSGSLDPRQVAEPDGRATSPRAMGVDECAISYWDRPAGRVDSLGYYPTAGVEEIEPYFDVAGYPGDAARPRARRRRSSSTPTTRPPTRPRSSCCVQRRQPGPGDAAARRQGPVDRPGRARSRGRRSTWDDERLALARTMANEAAMALENARLYEDARNLADRDPLTGFYNHRFLHERLGEEVVRAQRGRRPLSVLMLDLDDFKLVNDTFGHLFGDRVLTWTAELIRSTLRARTSRPATAATSSRSSCPRPMPTRRARAAERILGAFRDHAVRRRAARAGPDRRVDRRRPRSRPTAGPATELIAAADRALYRVKRDGGHDVAGAPGLGHPAAGRPRVVGTKVPPRRGPSSTSTRGWTRRVPDRHPLSRRERTHPTRRPAARTRRIVGSDAPGGSSPDLVLLPRPHRRAPARARRARGRSTVVARRPRRPRRVRRDPPSPGGRRPRGRPPRGGRVVRPDPVRACRARCRPTRSSAPSSRSSAERPAPTTSSSSAAGPTPASSRRRWSAPARACPTRPRSCRSPTSRIRSTGRGRTRRRPRAGRRIPRRAPRSRRAGRRGRRACAAAARRPRRARIAAAAPDRLAGTRGGRRPAADDAVARERAGGRRPDRRAGSRRRLRPEPTRWPRR